MKRTTDSPDSASIFWVSLLVGISLFLLRLLQWSLPVPIALLNLILQAVLFCCLGFTFIWSMIYVLRQFKSNPKRALLPIATNAIVIAFMLYFPFLEMSLKINFSLMQSRREEVVSLVKSQQLKASDRGQINLPPAYKATSDDGQIDLEKNNVLFYTFRGVDNYAGFVYIPGNQKPQVGEVIFGGVVVEVKKFKDRWFWISAT